jgi:hypothetical protein
VAEFAVLATLMLIAVAGTLLRNSSPPLRWSVGLTLFLLLTAWGISNTSGRQSDWLNVPVMGAAVISGMLPARAQTVRERPLVAFAASLGASLCGLLVGAVAAIEMGLLVP